MIRLTNEQWERIRNHFPEEHIPDGRPGRKPIPTRCVFEAVLWILNTGAQWHMLPQSYPNYKSVHRRFQTWCRDEVLRRVLMDVANELRDKGALDEAECFIDATFVMAKGGGAGIGPTKRGKGMKIMAIVDRHGLPLSVSTHAANHHEVRLVQLCFDFYMIEAKPENLIGDRAYDSDPLDEELRKDGIEMIAPHRSNRSKPPTQDRRRLSRYMRRWLVERFFAWIQWQRRQKDRAGGWGYWTDGWDGFPAARQRMLDAIAATRVSNPVFIGGDIHSYWITDLKSDFANLSSATIATEFVGTSITSDPPPREQILAVLPENPHVRFFESQYRGYVTVDLNRDRMESRLQIISDRRDALATVSTLKRFVVETGKPGAIPD